MNAGMKRHIKLHMLVSLTLLLLTAASALFSAIRAYAGSVPQIDNLRIHWVTADSVPDGQASRLYLYADNPDSRISLQYQIDVSFTGQQSYAPGSIRVLVPRRIFHKRSPYFTNGSVLDEGYGGISFSVPDAPGGSSLWHWEEAENDQYVIINDASISASAGIMFQISFTDLQPEFLVDMLPGDPLAVTVEVTTPDGNVETLTSETLTAVIDTWASLSASNADGTVFTTPENVPPAILQRLPGGEQSAPAYMFVQWNTWPYYNGTQPFSLSVDLWGGQLYGNGANIDGLLLGATQGSGSVISVTDGETPGDHFIKTVLSNRFDRDGTKNMNHVQHIWTAYPVAGLQADKTYTIRTVAAWELEESDPERDDDPRAITRQETEASVSYVHTQWVYPQGEFGVYKYTGSTPGHTHGSMGSENADSTASGNHKKSHTYEMGLAMLRAGTPVTLEFEVLSVGYGYSYTAGPLSEAGVSAGWGKDPANYLKWPYVLETTDDTITLRDANNSTVTLAAGSYRFDGITIGSPELFSYGRQTNERYRIPGSEFGFAPNANLQKPAVEIWIKKAGSSAGWELFNTETVRNGATRYVAFPEDTIGYRTRIATSEAACKLAVWPRVTLLPDEDILAIVEDYFDRSTTPSAVLTNNVQMNAVLYQPPAQAEILPEQQAWLESSGVVQSIDSSDSSQATLTGAGYDVMGTSDITFTNDPSNRQVLLHFTTKVDETSNLKDRSLYDLAVEGGVIPRETSATWFVLLPPNVELNTGSIAMPREDDRISSIQVIPDFRGTGLTMLVVRASLTPSPEKAHSNATFRDSPALAFDGVLSWTDLKLQSSTEVTAYIAFESGNPGTLGTYQYFQGKPDVWSVAVNTPRNIAAAMTDLDPETDDRRFVYSTGWERITVDQMEQTEFVKSVRADADGIWSRGSGNSQAVTVMEGQDYTYRLRIASKSDSRAAGILLFDSIENAVPSDTDEPNLDAMKNWSGAWNGKGQWRGTLTRVDMSALYNAGCNPVLYYSTVPGLAFGTLPDNPDDSFLEDRNGHYDLTDSSVWTQASGALGGIWYVPDGVPVTAVAIDARRTRWASDFSLAPGEVASVCLHMKAPDDHGDPGTWNAKGAYFHAVDNASSPEGIDWAKALEAGNNMHAFNSAMLVYTPQNASGSESYSRTVLRYGNTRVGLVPSIVSVAKTWNDDDNHDGKRPENVTVRLLYKSRSSAGAPEYWLDRNSDPVTLTLSEDNGWSGLFMDLPPADSNGDPYVFTPEEAPVDGYTAAVSTKDGRAFEIINTHANEKISVSGEKLWLTADGLAAETASSYIQLQLRREGSDGIVRDAGRSIRVTPDAAGRWLYTFPDQDRYERGGTEYRYSITESAPYGWISQDKPLPAGMELGFSFDPDDLSVFRNIWVPPFGSVLLIKHAAPGAVADKADTGNAQFTFSFQLTSNYYDNTPVTGEFEYTVFDRAPEGRGTVIPAGASAIRSGKISHNGTITLGLEQCALIKGLPENSFFRFVESPSDGWAGRADWYDYGFADRMEVQSVTFSNSYRAEGSFRLRGIKQMTGRLPESGEFSFELVDRTPGSRTEGRVISKTVNTACTESTAAEDGTVTGTAAVLFSQVPVSLDTYGGSRTLVYEVRETAPFDSETLPDGTVRFRGVTYDTAPHMVTVTVTDNGDGTARAEFSGEDYPLVFRNKYHAEAEVFISARKTMSGRSPRSGEFSFEIRRDGAAAGSAPLAAGTSSADGIISFSPAVTLTEKDLGAADEASVKLLISEVPGDDPSIQYLKDPVPYEVTLLRKQDGSLYAVLPGQEAEHDETTCPVCSGTGIHAGLFGSVINITVDYETYTATVSYDGDPIPLSGVFNDTWLDICPDCGGTGRDPLDPASPCSSCGGAGFSFKPCTHPTQTEDGKCPDCLGNDMAPVSLANGDILLPTGESMALDQLIMALDIYGLDASRFTGGSYTAYAAYILTPAQYAEARTAMKVPDDARQAYLTYISSNNPCPACAGTGKIQGDWVVTGDPVLPVLENHLKGGVRLSVTKTMEGEPAEEPFRFILLEGDAEGRERLVAEAQNDSDGLVEFDPFWLDPDGAVHTFIIRETAGEDSTIAYDTSEIRYQVTVTRDERDMPVVSVDRTEGDGVFRNIYRDGAISVTVSMKNANSDAEPPVFPVTVILTGRGGDPLANRSFSAPPARARLRSAGTPILKTDENGRGTIMVTGDSTLVIPGIPHGTSYELSQAADTMPKHFSQSGAEGTKGTVTGGAESKASFENTYSVPKPSASVSPSPTPTPTPTPKSSPSASPSPTPTPTPAATAKAVSAPTPTFTPTPSPAPSATPVTTPATTDLPGPTSTPNPYVYRFSFTKKWEGGAEDSIDFVVYNADGTVRSKKFNKKIISDTEWLYEAWFTSPADFYIIETVPRGYRARYENTGIHAGVTDRCCNGGTIVNYTVPKTGDRTNLLIFIGLSLLGIGCFIASFILGPCAESRSVRKWKKTARQANGNRMDPDGI